MPVFAQEPEINQAATLKKPIGLDSAPLSPRVDLNLIRRLQRTIGNQAVLRLLERNIGDSATDPSSAAVTSLGYGLDRIQRRGARPALIQRSSSAVSSPGHAVTDGKPPGAERDEEIIGHEGASTSPPGEQPASAPPAAQPATAAERAGSAAPSAAKESGAIGDAPSASYIVPFDRHPVAAPGERIIFRGDFTDPSPAGYQLEYSTTGGHFNAADGPTTVTVAGLTSGNVNFFVPTPWDGRSAVQVVLKVRKKSDNSIAQTETWDFGLKSRYPTTITQKEGTGEVNLPGIYTYDIGPALATGSKPFYEHQTILERFGNWTLANIVPADIAAAYRTTHPLANAAAVSQHFLGNYAGNNGTFTVNANDQIGDQHGVHPDLSNLVTNLAAPKDVEVALPQTYEANPGTALGNFTITRILKADGTTWKVKKG